jgi:nicotinate-nucleotide adenylyltransferase
MNLGIFGGTFDPPHMGHLIAAQEVHYRLGLDRTLWVPAAVPPHKLDRETTPGELRLEMVRAAIAGDGRFEASGIELRRPGVSYTVDTLRELGAADPDARLHLIVGSDQLELSHTWRAWDEIKALATVVGYHRHGAGGGKGGEEAGVLRVPVPLMEVSSTEIRRRIAAGEPIRYLVPADVEAILLREGLYSGRDERP